MNQKGYAHILDAVAGDQVPKDLDLAPNILDRIQKRKGFRMQPRTRLMSAAMLAAIVMIVLFYTVPGMAADLGRAIGRWFGYVPGVGFVHEGQIRVLEHPVSVTRDGVTVTVDQVVLDPERTVLLYSVDGIPNDAIVTGLNPYCAYAVSLRLPDRRTPSGRTLLASPNGVQAWASGYQHRFNFPALPADVNDATLGISCLFLTKPGAAPENWEIPLHFIPVPPDVTAFPVIEIPTPTAPAPGADTAPTATEPPAQSPAASLEAEAAQQPASITLTFERAVQMDDGYLIYAAVHWQDTPFASLDVLNPTETLHLLDANGQPMLYEIQYDEQTRMDVDQRQTIFAIKTAPVQVPGPLTLVLDAVSVNLAVEGTTFVFDPGPDPKTGQTWTLDRDIPIGKYTLRVRNATAELGGYSFEMSSENGIVNASVADMQHPIASGGGGGGAGKPGDTFFSSFNYADGKLPEGPVTITVGSVEVWHVQRLEAQWTPPAASTNVLPTQPAACLTAASWKASLAQKPALPAEVTGRVLTSNLADANTGQWNATISNLDGSDAQVFEGAQDGALSADGKKLVYSVYGKGLSIADLDSQQTAPVPGTGEGDFNPIWSPDGRQVVFMRGMGIFDLFIVNPDGSEMRQLTHGGVQEWPAGWLANGRLLYSVPGRENEYTIYQLDVQSGASEAYTQDNTDSISPDGQSSLTSERTFGDRWLVSISAVDGSNRWLLNDSSLWVLSTVWSPDGQWLLAGVSATDSGSTIGTLINLRNCQVIPLPALKGNILSWVP